MKLHGWDNRLTNRQPRPNARRCWSLRPKVGERGRILMQIILCNRRRSASGKRAIDQAKRRRKMKASGSTRCRDRPELIGLGLQTSGPGGASEETRNCPGHPASHASQMVSAFQGSGGIPRKGVGKEDGSTEASVDRVVESLHPNGHSGLAPATGPPIGHSVEPFPETSPEANPHGQPGRAVEVRRRSRCGREGNVVRVRRDVLLLQRGG